MSTPLPEPPQTCWPIDLTACPALTADGVDEDLAEIAKALAAQTLRMLTGYSVGGCPVLLRPCSEGCLGDYRYYGSPGVGFSPYIDAFGKWHNSCGCSNGTSCSCTNLPAVYLASPVGTVVEVKVDGEILAPAAYRLVESRLLRIDGGDWPACQRLELPDTEAGTFSVSLIRGAPVDALGARMAGILACEYFKALSDDRDCRLPPNVTNITRQGVTMELDRELFPSGLTGVREVDVYLRAHNPFGLQRPSAVWTPDRVKPVRFL